jgi:prepilin-type N-terminal cleavage/methylation domain-containing protein
MHDRHGFTLIELLVAVVIFGVLSLLFTGAFTANQRQYVQIDQVVDAQQKLRAISDLMESDIRHAGFMVSESAAMCAVDNDDGPDILYLSDADVIDPGNDLQTYGGAEVQAGVTGVSSGGVSLNLNTLTIENDASRAAYDTDNDGTNDSDFAVNSGVIIVDVLDPSRGSACGRVTAVSTASTKVAVTVISGALGADGGGPTQLVLIPAHEYRIDNQGNMLRNGLILIPGIEDFQLAFFFDLDGNFQIDSGETRGDGTGGDYVASAIDAADLREIRFNLIARGQLQDPEFNGAFLSVENRDDVAGSDGFRRRLHTSTVMLRNVGIRMEDV